MLDIFPGVVHDLSVSDEDFKCDENNGNGNKSLWKYQASVAPNFSWKPLDYCCINQ